MRSHRFGGFTEVSGIFHPVTQVLKAISEIFLKKCKTACEENARSAHQAHFAHHVCRSVRSVRRNDAKIPQTISLYGTCT